MINDAGIFMAVMISCRHPHLTLPNEREGEREVRGKNWRWRVLVKAFNEFESTLKK